MSLEVKNLSKKYGEKTVVENLSFEMKNPGVFALLGTNGAGKTTSIRMMLNMLSRDSGEVLWNGAPLDTATCNVGYLAEERGLYPKYTLMDQFILQDFAGLRRRRRRNGSATGPNGLRSKNISILRLLRQRMERRSADVQRHRPRRKPISFQREISRRSSS